MNCPLKIRSFCLLHRSAARGRTAKAFQNRRYCRNHSFHQSLSEACQTVCFMFPPITGHETTRKQKSMIRHGHNNHITAKNNFKSEIIPKIWIYKRKFSCISCFRSCRFIGSVRLKKYSSENSIPLKAQNVLPFIFRNICTVNLIFFTVEIIMNRKSRIGALSVK